MSKNKKVAEDSTFIVTLIVPATCDHPIWDAQLLVAHGKDKKGAVEELIKLGSTPLHRFVCSIIAGFGTEHEIPQPCQDEKKCEKLLTTLKKEYDKLEGKEVEDGDEDLVRFCRSHAEDFVYLVLLYERASSDNIRIDDLDEMKQHTSSFVLPAAGDDGKKKKKKAESQH